MTSSTPQGAVSPFKVALVDGDATVRHARQLMLRSEDYEVRSYATCSAILADPRSRDFPCIVLDIGLNDQDGAAVLRKMRATGWQGRAILLDGQDAAGAYVREAAAHGDRVMERTVGDRSLVAAICQSIRGRSNGGHS